MTRIRQILLTTLLILTVNIAYPQSVTFDVQTLTSIAYDINTVTKVENTQTTNGAFAMHLKNRSGGAKSVYARISSYTAPAGFIPSTGGIQVDYVSDNTNDEYNLITTPLTMTGTDQRLFTMQQYAKNSTYTFNYDVKLLPTNWQWPPGYYTFTILFTFVSP